LGIKAGIELRGSEVEEIEKAKPSQLNAN